MAKHVSPEHVAAIQKYIDADDCVKIDVTQGSMPTKLQKYLRDLRLEYQEKFGDDADPLKLVDYFAANECVHIDVVMYIPNHKMALINLMISDDDD